MLLSVHGVGAIVRFASSSEVGLTREKHEWGCRAVTRYALFRARLYVRLLNLDNHRNFHRAVGRKCLHSHGGMCVLADVFSEHFHH